ALYLRDDRQRARRRLWPGFTGRPARRRREQALRRCHDGARLRRAAGPADRNGRAGRLSADPRSPHRRGAEVHGQGGAMTTSASQDELVWLAQSVGLFYLIGMSVVVVAYVYWPSNKKRFEKAAEAILHGEDKPWR